MSEVFFLWLLPLILMIILGIYQKKNLEQPIDRFWMMFWYLLAFVPVVNLWCLIVFCIWVCVDCAFGTSFHLKDTKINRWLFNSQFN